jgi:hypothetical protein
MPVKLLGQAVALPLTALMKGQVALTSTSSWLLLRTSAGRPTVTLMG